MTTMPLNREELRTLIAEKKLVENMTDMETQLTPNGIDLTVSEIRKFLGSGKVDFSNDERELPQTEELPLEDDWYHLTPGVYLIKTNEIVNLPTSLIAIAFPRSSLLRMGAFIQNGFWDAGYSGSSQFLLSVLNPKGLHLKKNARVNQLVFLKMNETAEGYSGTYQEHPP